MATKCPTCGAPLENGACGYCGYSEQVVQQPAQQVVQQPTYAPNNVSYPVQPQAPQPQVIINNQVSGNPAPGFYASDKSKVAALLLCLFFGYLGFHRFYVGKVGTGLIWLCTLGFVGIGWIIDLFCIIFGSFTDKFGLPLR